MSDKKLPQHIAIIMDGNRRWARQNNLSAIAGHKKVTDEIVEDLIDHCGHLGIPYLTLWAWSSENWERPSKEVKAIMRLFRWSLKNKADKFIKKGARLNLIGDIEAFPLDIQDGLHQMMEKSKDNDAITITFALNYGGHDEILRAIKKYITSLSLTKREIKMGLKKITPKTFSHHLDTKDIPDPDLLIRPGGRKRLSGFMPWQTVYTELYFTDTLMPDFTPEKLDEAIKDYQQRKRTFGGGSFEKL